ncbi:class I SAM-dependent rRNA methyltransferase [Atopobiaceae bacterium HCP3S3_A4]
MKQARPYPKAYITKKAARMLSQGYLWVFEGEIVRMEPDADGRPAENGAIVDLFEENGTWQGAGLLSMESKIRVRVLSHNANDRFDEGFWRRRILWAWEHRKAVMGPRSMPNAEPDTNCCRILFSEADGVPGLIVDRYEDVLVAQVGTYGMEMRKEMLFPLVLDVLRSDGVEIRGIYERADSPARRLEGLELHKGWWPEPGKPLPESARVMAQENGLLFDLDIENSQKTGFFLDQKYNRRAVRELSQGRRVLDCFSHVGPFGLNAAAGGAEFVRCVDISDTAIALAQENAKLNHLDEKMDFTCADVVEYLPELVKSKARLKEEGGPFDLIILDPPAFTKSRSAVAHAKKGYREINEWAMRLLPRGGYLATCSCSRFMTTKLLEEAIAEAAHNANVQLKQIELRQQAPDHPILWGMPDTHYLDFLTFQIV